MKVAIALAPGASRHLIDSAARFGHEVVGTPVDAFDIVRSLDGNQPAVVVATATPSVLNSGVLAECDARGIRVVAVVEVDAHRRHARDIGLLDSVGAHDEWPAIDEFLRSNFEVSALVERQLNGKIIAVWGPAGAPGRTSIAIAIASELAAAGFTVSLADADVHAAAVAPSLGLLDEAPGFAAACRLASTDSLNREQLERVAQRVDVAGAGLWVLTGIGQPSRWPELSASRVQSTLEACRSWVDFTVVDVSSSLESDEEISSDVFSPRRNAATTSSLGAADHIIAVGAGDPVGLARFVRAHAELVELVHPTPISVVINKVRASVIGLDPHGQVRRTLARFAGIHSPSLVPYDLAAFDAALVTATAVSEAAPKSAATSALRKFVRARFVPARERLRSRRSKFALALPTPRREAVARKEQPAALG